MHSKQQLSVFAALSVCVAFAQSESGTQAAAPNAPAKPIFGASLSVPGVTFSPTVFERSWTSHSSTGGLSAEADGSRKFTMLITGKPQGGRISGSANFAQVDGGAIHALWRAVPDTTADIAEFCVGGHFDWASLVGGEALADGQSVPFPAETGPKAHLFRGSVKELVLHDAAGAERFRAVFDAPTRILLQDGRHWSGSQLTVRFFFAEGSIEAGREYTLGATFSTPAAGALALQEGKSLRLVAGQDWIPFKASPWVEPGSAIDFSTVVPHHAPAGAFGRVIAVGDHFELEGRPGVPQRFYGVNICGDANTPSSPEASERFAANLARCGYNTLRIHHHERNIVTPNGQWKEGLDDTMPDPERLDMFDGLVAACIRNGIYLTTDLFVSRSWLTTWRALGIDRDGCIPDTGTFKVLCAFWDPAFENLCAWSRNFLGHVNPYTGRSLAQEPALCALALVNEGNLGNWGSGFLRDLPCVREAWEKWIAEKRESGNPSFAGIPDTFPDDIYADDGDTPAHRHAAAFAIFLAEKEAALAERLRAFLRDEMKCETPISSLSSWYNPSQYQTVRRGFDYVDDHFYVDHPSFLDVPWRLPSRCPNTNPMSGSYAGARPVAFRRLMDKPFCLTEFNYSGPGRFRGVGGIATGALGALQNWSGMWRFAWSHGRQGVEQPETKGIGYFDLSGDPLSLAADRATLCLFLREDMDVLGTKYPVTLYDDDLADPAWGAPKCQPASWIWLGWYARTGTQIAAGRGPSFPVADGKTTRNPFAREADSVRSDLATLGASKPGDGAVSIDAETGTFLLNTPRTSGGFAERGAHDAGALSFELHDAPATVWVSTLDGEPVEGSARMLLTHLTDVQNSDIEYADDELTILLNWGHLPHLMRRGSADVALAVAPGAWKVWRLAPSGRRIAEVPGEYDEQAGRLRFTARTDMDPSSATYLYEVAIAEP